MSLVIGMLVISVVVAAIAVLVFMLWRRSTGKSGTSRSVSSGPHTDSHAVAAAATAVEIGTKVSTAPSGRHPSMAAFSGDLWQDIGTKVSTAPSGRPSQTVSPDAPMPPGAARPPHPSGLGAAELAAIVEDGLASLRIDVDRLGEFIDSVDSSSAVPEDLPGRPAAHQVALVDQMTAMITAELDLACRLAETVAVDVRRGDRARAEVHGELARIGLPAGFFVAMDTTAADLAVDLLRARLAVERLGRRFAALSSLYSSVRPVLDQLGDLAGALERAAAIADPWRQSAQTVDLTPQDQVAQMLQQ